MHTTANMFYKLFQEANRDERRTSPRSSPSDLTACRMRLPNENTTLMGWVNDLSIRGISIVSDEPFVPGTKLEITVFNSGSTSCLKMDLCIVRCITTPNGGFILGAEFSRELTYEELVPFLL